MLLELNEVSKSFGGVAALTGVSFGVKQGEVFGVIGPNGAGKTTLFKIIMDKVEADKGVKVLGTNVNVGYYDQEQSDLNLDKTIIDEVWDDFPNLTTSKLRSYLASFLFTGDDVFKVINTLSGGEKCRINLLKLILSKSNLLLLDEPTNHLDVDAKEELKRALKAYKGSILLICHEPDFYEGLATDVWDCRDWALRLS